MVHLILDINFGFQALKFLFFYQINIVNIIFFIIYIEGSMGIFILYIGIIKP
jgi:hypothetical protein